MSETETNIKAARELLAAHDWYGCMSDDSRYFYAAEANMDKIRNLLSCLSVQEANAIINSYKPA